VRHPALASQQSHAASFCFRVQNSEFQFDGFGLRGGGFRVDAFEFRVQGLGFRVQDSGFRLDGSGLRG
jgi:hypothetical protein